MPAQAPAYCKRRAAFSAAVEVLLQGNLAAIAQCSRISKCGRRLKYPEFSRYNSSNINFLFLVLLCQGALRLGSITPLSTALQLETYIYIYIQTEGHGTAGSDITTQHNCSQYRAHFPPSLLHTILRQHYSDNSSTSWYVYQHHCRIYISC